MSNLIRNERVKLVAGLLNAGAMAVVTVGVFTPLALSVYGIGEPPKNIRFLGVLSLVCIGVSVALHLLAHLVLEGLDDSDD
jgi:O-phosphoseryl-tRNA(Cys) synthetase